MNGQTEKKNNWSNRRMCNWLILNESYAIAKAFNISFISIGPNLANQIPQTKRTFKFVSGYQPTDIFLHFSREAE